MKYCPKCKRLYNDEDTNCTCADCKRKVLKTIEDEGTSVFLCSGDVLERDRVQAALQENGIPSVYTRHMVTGTSQLLSGMDFDGFDILVPFELYEKAYDLAVGIGAIKLDGEQIVDEMPETDGEAEDMSHGKRTAVRIISAIMFILFMAGIIYSVDAIAAAIRNYFS